jgi:RNA polymerase sigma factor (TIGR02999 family)
LHPFFGFLINTRVIMTRSTAAPHEVTQLLIACSDGNQDAFNQLFPLVYEELRRLAHRYMTQERPGHTLQTTAVVHEAYLRLIDQKHVQWQNRAHFFAIASQMMRRILITHAQSHAYAKRGGGALKVSLDEAAILSPERATELIALDEALKSLTAIDSRRSQVVELRFFGGLDNEEIAEVLKISPNTVTRDWNVAKAWLYREMNKEQENES